MSLTVFPAENIDIDADGLRRHLTLYLKVVGGKIQKVLKWQAMLLCREMLDYTLPVEDGMGPGKGTSRAAKQVGQAVVESQIERIFAPLYSASYGQIARANDYGVFSAWVGDRQRNDMPIPHFLEGGATGMTEWNRFQAGFSDVDMDEQRPGNFEAYNGSYDSIKSIHEASRGGPANYSTKNTTEQYFIADYRNKLPAYIKQVQKRVGRLKAGWYTASTLLGDNKAQAAWIVNNQWDTGYVLDELSNASTPAITVGNLRHYRMSIAPGVRGWKTCLNHRGYAIRFSIVRLLSLRGDFKTLEELARNAETADLFFETEAPF